MLKRPIGLAFLFGMFYSLNSMAATDNTAAVVELRSSCNELNKTIDNCFTSLDALNTWIQVTRTPEVSDPLAVRIGPGTFPGLIQCIGNQHISLIGSGSTNTILKRSPASAGRLSVMVLKDNCNLNVQDLMIENLGGLAAVQVQDQASSTFNILSKWTNVEILSTGYTWLEEHCDPAITNSKHFWTGSKLTSITGSGALEIFAKAYVSCAENWFHATEITAKKEINTSFPQATALLVLGETHVYGGVIRAIAGPGVDLPAPAPFSGGAGPQGLVGIYAMGPGAEVHVHGAGIDVFSSEPNDIAGILAEDDAHVHIMEASFNMFSCNKAPNCSGRLQRIANFGGMVKSTFQWPNGTVPPNLTSQDGADTFVETDCSDTGCQTPGSQPHMLIYSTACTDSGGNWFDVVTGSCR